jgi:DNA polymerase
VAGFSGVQTYCLDFEARSRADLKAVGGRRYWEDPSTEAICCAWWCVETGEVGVWLPGQPCPFPEGSRLAAHNWHGFDRFGCIRLGWIDQFFANAVDTSQLARKAGLPGALDAIGQLYGVPKDKEASRFTKSLSSVKRPKNISADVWRTYTPEEKRRRGTLPPITSEVLDRVIPYCVLDVQIMAMAWHDLAEWIEIDADVERVDAIVNDRGVYFDRELATALLFWDAEHAARIIAESAKELGWTPEQVRAAARSNQQFTELTGLENARKSICRGVDHPLVRARAALATITTGKLLAGLARASDDGRLRDSQRYYGAHTGRWAGRGMQLQNLTRPHGRYEEWTDEQIDELAQKVTNGEHEPTPDEIVLLLRATICAAPGHTLAVCDFSGVEARALAWAAGDYRALETFRSGKDPYKVAASIIFGVAYDQVTKVQRHVGKIAELACGYGQGGRKFAETAALMGADLAAAGVNSFEVVKSWRRLHAPIVRFWRDVEDAFVKAIAGEASTVACFEFVPNGRDVAVFLPTGRPIVYRGARLGSDGGIVCDGAHGPEHTYGGKLVENLIQALCRDLMALCLVEAESQGLRPVMTVHDEIVVEVPRSAGQAGYDALHRIMTTVPTWAEGFPLGAAGFVGVRYRK